MAAVMVKASRQRSVVVLVNGDLARQELIERSLDSVENLWVEVVHSCADAARLIPEATIVVVTLDTDGGCPVEMVRRLRAQGVTTPIVFVGDSTEGHLHRAGGTALVPTRIPDETFVLLLSVTVLTTMAWLSTAETLRRCQSRRTPTTISTC